MRSTNNPCLSPNFYKNRVAVCLGIAAILSAAHFYAPYVDRGPVICPLHGLFGLPCPTCGMTHALCAIMRGDIAGAIRHNLLGIPLFAGVIVAFFTSIYEMIVRRRTALHGLLYSYKLAYTYVAVAIVYHVLRCCIWLHNGTLVAQYVRTSWTYRIFFKG